MAGSVANGSQDSDRRDVGDRKDVSDRKGASYGKFKNPLHLRKKTGRNMPIAWRIWRAKNKASDGKSGMVEERYFFGLYGFM
jgi:hypothetical protein